MWGSKRKAVETVSCLLNANTTCKSIKDSSKVNEPKSPA